MYISSLTLKNFRNYANEKFIFSKGLNILIGKNAQGKTNCAEAIFLLCTGYSKRAVREKELILYGENSASVMGVAETDFGKVSVSIEYYLDRKKSMRVNDIPVLKMGELLGNINSVYFSPDELKLIKETPSDRRRFLDISLSQLSKNYFYALSRYNRILAQRNNLLKKERTDVLYETLPIWDIQLCNEGAKIIFARCNFIKQLQPYAKENHLYLTDNLENLELSMEGDYPTQESEIRDYLNAELNKNLEKDIRLGYTSFGPHRDDMKILINNKDVKTYCSQGQQRSCALSMKLAELDIFKNKIGEYPLLILDDVLSELDKFRQIRLLSRLGEVQTILTTTNIDSEIFEGIAYHKIEIGGGNRT